MGIETLLFILLIGLLVGVPLLYMVLMSLIAWLQARKLKPKLPEGAPSPAPTTRGAAAPKASPGSPKAIADPKCGISKKASSSAPGGPMSPVSPKIAEPKSPMPMLRKSPSSESLELEPWLLVRPAKTAKLEKK
jgi:hypothetical protein